MRFNRDNSPSNAALTHCNTNDAVVETALGNISECLTQSFAEEPAHQVGFTLRAKKKSMPPWAAYTIDDFCFAHRLSRAQLYVLLSRGDGPWSYTIGRRRYISLASASAWVRRNEMLASEQSSRGADG